MSGAWASIRDALPPPRACGVAGKGPSLHTKPSSLYTHVPQPYSRDTTQEGLAICLLSSLPLQPKGVVLPRVPLRTSHLRCPHSCRKPGHLSSQAGTQ